MILLVLSCIRFFIYFFAHYDKILDTYIMNKMRDFKRGFKGGIPIALGYFAVSFAFGITAVSEGLNWWEATLISVFNLTSAGQFAGLNIMIAGGTLIEMALSQFVINLRYALMSVALSQKADKTINSFFRWIFAFFHTDEIFAVAAGEKQFSKSFFSGLLIAPFWGWTLGTLFGAIGGNILPEIICNALGISLYGMFIAIFLPAAKVNKKLLSVVIIAVVLSTAFRYMPLLKEVSSGFSIIICAVAAASVGALLFPVEEEVQES